MTQFQEPKNPEQGLNFGCSMSNLKHLQNLPQELARRFGPSLDEKNVGVWVRTSAEKPYGTPIDTGSTVVWLQTHNLFGDLRIPDFSRPVESSVGAQQVLQLSSQQSFAGHTMMSGERCEWISDCGFRPPSAGLDTARLEQSSEANRIVEFCDDGVVEVWEKQVPNTDRVVALQLLDEVTQAEVAAPKDLDRARTGFLLVVGDQFMRVLGRTAQNAIPQSATGQSLTDYVDELDPARALDVIHSYQCCFGSVSESTDWTTKHSTDPSLEGRPLYEGATMARFGNVILERVGVNSVRRWLVQEMRGSLPRILL